MRETRLAFSKLSVFRNVKWPTETKMDQGPRVARANWGKINWSQVRLDDEVQKTDDGANKEDTGASEKEKVDSVSGKGDAPKEESVSDHEEDQY